MPLPEIVDSGLNFAFSGCIIEEKTLLFKIGLCDSNSLLSWVPLLLGIVSPMERGFPFPHLPPALRLPSLAYKRKAP